MRVSVVGRQGAGHFHVLIFDTTSTAVKYLKSYKAAQVPPTVNTANTSQNKQLT